MEDLPEQEQRGNLLMGTQLLLSRRGLGSLWGDFFSLLSRTGNKGKSLHWDTNDNKKTGRGSTIPFFTQNGEQVLALGFPLGKYLSQYTL